MLFWFHCTYQICWYTATVIDDFDINWPDWNYLKSWWVTYNYNPIPELNTSFLRLYVNESDLVFIPAFWFPCYLFWSSNPEFRWRSGSVVGCISSIDPEALPPVPESASWNILDRVLRAVSHFLHSTVKILLEREEYECF